MRRLLIVAIAIAAGCSSDESTAPSPSQPSVSSIKIEGPETLLVSDSVQLVISLLDVSEKPISNRALTFTSSDPEIAGVSGSGVVKAVKEGFVTITVSSESVRAKKSLGILPRAKCSVLSQACLASAERYVLALVNDLALPVQSPWGVGDWDYDEDAGTWRLVHAEIILFADGYYSYATSHRAASGATSTFTFGGRYERGSGSVGFYPDGSLSSSATVTETGLVERWDGGMTFVYVKSP